MKLAASIRTRCITVEWVSGSCMLVDRRAAQEVGLLDERFFLYVEDVDLCRRLRSAGFSASAACGLQPARQAGQ